VLPFHTSNLNPPPHPPSHHFNQKTHPTKPPTPTTPQPNYRLIAKYYGKGTTYDSIEGRFRHIKRQAEGLKAASSAEEGSIDLDSPAQSFASTSSATFNASSQNGTPKKARAPRTPKRDGTSGGRVSKTSTTPTRTGRGRKGGVDGRNGVAEQQQQQQQGVKMEMGSNGESEASGSMLDELNGIVDGEVDWMGGGVSEGRGRGGSGFGGKGRNGNSNGCGHGALVGGEYGNENGGYWDVGHADEEEEVGEMV